MQTIERGTPLAGGDEVVPVGDEILDRTAGVTEGHAAVHAAPGLLFQLAFRERLDELAPVAQPFRDRPVGTVLPRKFEKARGIAHAAASSAASARR